MNTSAEKQANYLTFTDILFPFLSFILIAFLPSKNVRMAIEAEL